MVHYCEICPNNETHIDENGQLYITCSFWEELLEQIELQGIKLNDIDCKTGGIFDYYNNDYKED